MLHTWVSGSSRSESKEFVAVQASDSMSEMAAPPGTEHDVDGSLDRRAGGDDRNPAGSFVDHGEDGSLRGRRQDVDRLSLDVLSSHVATGRALPPAELG
jgi:hypothetical protein